MSDWFKKNISDDIANLIIRLKIKATDNIIVERDFRPDVNIDYDKLEEQLEETPAAMAFWSAVLAEQKAIVEAKKFQMERRRAAIGQRNRELAGQENIKITQSAIDDIVIQDADYVKMRAGVIIAERDLSKLYGIVQSIQMRSEHLRSLSGFKRQEMQRP